MALATLVAGSVTVAGVVAAAAPAEASYTAGSRVTYRWSGAIHTGDKSAVNAAYWSRYAPNLNRAIDWQNGSVDRCLPGSNSSGTAAATLRSLNFVRSMAGLAPVTFSSTLNAKAQRAALIMDANNALSHAPSSAWKCYTSAGATAASKSNLVIASSGLTTGDIVKLYMDDPGADNGPVGHRRWILNPFATTMGSGSTKTANALTVIGPSSAYRPNPAYVPWPTAGYFPNTMEPGGRWSLSVGRSNTSFTYARVAVYYQDGTRVPVHKYSVHAGYAQPTLVWKMSAGIPDTGRYHVVVSGIHRAGSSRSYSYDYTVTLFTPHR